MNGYSTNEKCYVCEKVKNNKIEPRFGYVVCEDHYDVPPACLDKAKEQYKKLSKIDITSLVCKGVYFENRFGLNNE